MRTYKVIGHCPLHRKTNLFRALNLQSLIVKRWRPAFAEAASRRQV
jgi:hypothetical protein